MFIENEQDSILAPPIFNDSLTQVKLHALINSSVSLPCFVYGFPKPSVTWSFETNTVLEPNREEEYVIDHVQVSRSIMFCLTSVLIILYLGQSYRHL